MPKAVVPLEKLEDERQAILKLARLQVELLTPFRENVSKGLVNVTALGRKHGLAQQHIQAVCKGQHAVTGGKVLRSIASCIGRPDLEEQIITVSKPLSDRKRGLSSFSADTINLVFDLRIAWSTSGATAQQFAHAFEKNERVVCDALLDKHTGLATMENDKHILQEIRASLETYDQTEHPLTVSERVSELGEEVVRFYDQLRPFFKSNGKLAKRIGCHEDTLRRALRGQSSESQLEKMVEAMKLEASKRIKTAPSTTAPVQVAAPVVAKVTPPAPQQTVVPQPGPAMSFLPAGVTSPDGVQCVLLPGSFVPIQGDPGEEFITYATRTIMHARAVLNIATQLTDAVVRQRVQQALNPEVKELYRAQKLFGHAYPNRVLEAINAELETMNLWDRQGKPVEIKKGDT
jgi:hypothetical protein